MRGSKHQLFINNSKSPQINLYTTCIDNMKAYNSLSHTWISECLALYKVNRILNVIIENSMGLRKRTFQLNSK